MPEPYGLLLTSNARDDLKRINRSDAERIVKKMRWVAANAELVQHEPLKGQWSDYYRWRIGDYRAIYELDHDGLLVIVAFIGHRREVYDE